VSREGSFDTGRFARTSTLILFVTTVFLFLAANRLEGEVFRIGAVAIGTIALITAIVSFLIAAGSAYDS